MDAWLKDNLVCPRDFTSLREDGQTLVCEKDHAYPYVDGLPVMLVAGEPSTHAHCHLTLDSLSAGDDKSDVAPGGSGAQASVDPFVQRSVAHTCGFYFAPVVGRLTEYPVPTLSMPKAYGERFLDVGCNWGRWCISASRLGYKAVGIDPEIEAVQAARRVAKQVGVDAQYVVADARHLPFRPGSFDSVHSYSVLMHFAKEDSAAAIWEMARVLKPGGNSLVQMANTFGLRNLQIQIQRGWNKPLERSSFHTRYRTPAELMQLFNQAFGSSKIEAEGFFSTSSGSFYMSELPLVYRVALKVSRALTQLSQIFPPLKYVADSLYMRSVRSAAGRM